MLWTIISKVLPFSSAFRLLLGAGAILVTLAGLIWHFENVGAAKQELKQVKTDQRAVQKAKKVRERVRRQPEKKTNDDRYVRD